jgi:hypothetical protein
VCVCEHCSCVVLRSGWNIRRVYVCVYVCVCVCVCVSA